MSRKNEFDILIAVLHISGLLIYLEFKNKKQFLKNYPKTSDSTIFKFISRRHFMHSCFVFLSYFHLVFLLHQGHKEDHDFAHFGEILTTSSFRLPILDLDSNHKKKADKKAKKSSNKSNYKMYYSYQIRLNINKIFV